MSVRLPRVSRPAGESLPFFRPARGFRLGETLERLFRAAPLSLGLLGAACLFAPPAGAVEATAVPEADERPRVEVSTALLARELRVTARLVPGLPESVARRLVSGLPTTSSWEIGLYAHRGLWPDGFKDSRRYDVTVTYRPATGDFAIERRLDDRLLETSVVATRAEAVASLQGVQGLPCFVMQKHLDGKTLVVKARCAYATGVSLGVVPTTEETARARSKTFVWREPPAAR